MRRSFFLSYLFLILLACSSSSVILAGLDGASGETGYYRYPAIHGEIIVFVAEGDLWKVSVNGGTARRLTTHPDQETHPAISPDGKMIAFTARYEGPADVYAMPIDGGLPKRLTSNSRPSFVQGWSPDGMILYSTGSFSTLPNTQIVSISPSTAQFDIIPLSQAADGAYHSSGDVFYFTRLPFQGSYTKRYHGGSAQDIWKFEDGLDEAINLTKDYTGTNSSPMYDNGRIYFLSDRDGIMNIWSMDESGNDKKQHTYQSGFDAKSPSLSNGKIVYQSGADLFLYDITTNTDKKLDIHLSSDFDHLREKWIKEPFTYLESMHLSPSNDKIVMTARGRVFVAPVEKGRLIEATHENGIRYRDVQFLPGTDSLIGLSDASGEMEFWQIPGDGIGNPKQLTDNGKISRFDGIPSPDGKFLAYTDKDQKLWLYDINDNSHIVIDTSEIYDISNAFWAPDNRWLAYCKNVATDLYQIFIYNVEDKSKFAITSERYEDYSPFWSPDGKWLYFLSDRNFQPLTGSPWGTRQPFTSLDKMTKIFMIPLKKDQISPFQQENELSAKKEEEYDKDDKGKKDEKDDKDKDDEEEIFVISIDTDGIISRLMEVPVPAGNYFSMSANDKQLFWLSRPMHADGNELQTIEIKNKDAEVKTLLSGVRSYELSQDGKMLLVRKGDAFYVIEAKTSAPSELSEHKVDLSDWTFTVDPKREWRQMFIDAWRMERDYFYDPNMHELDWEGILDKYLPLVDRVTDRNELSDLIGEMVGELSTLHIYVFGGDFRKGDDDIKAASLGALLMRDEKRGGFRVEYIYKSDPDEPHTGSPLNDPGVNVKEGDVIVEVNGVAALSVPQLEILLRGQVGNQVRMKIKPSGSGANRDVIVKPISSGDIRNLRYIDWEYTRRLKVEEDSDDDIGYVHLRNMGTDSYTAWVRDFYSSLNKKGLIVDVRNNTGGSTDSWILSSLIRKPWVYWKSRTGRPYPNMQSSFGGHVVVLCNEWTASDGELFCEGIRQLGIGKVIGVRTWGGEIWLSYGNRMVDRGIASAAQSGLYIDDSEWVIEGLGFEPDIVVDNLPHETFKGKDAQLDAAIEYLKEQIRLHPVEVPKPPPYPDKSFKKK
ncbi:MAG: S41 family peptidase [Candidatus Zixiibacteriota bacterium]